MVLSPGDFNGIRAHYNIRTDPELGLRWAALRRVRADGFVYVRQCARALAWLQCLFEASHAAPVLHRRLRVGAWRAGARWRVVTDASPWGVGGVLWQDGRRVAWFAEPLPEAALSRYGATVGDARYQSLWEMLAITWLVLAWAPRFGRRRSAWRFALTAAPRWGPR